MRNPSELLSEIGPIFGTDDVHLRQVLDFLPVGAYTCDASGLITYFNRTAARMWGRAPELNDPVDRYCGSHCMSLADGSPLPHEQCWMALALKTGEEYSGKEVVVTREDGSQAHVLAHVSPIRDRAGNIVGGVNVLVDITTQAKGEASQAQLAAIVESSDDAIVSKTLNGQILSWNRGAEQVFGYTAEEAVGSSIMLIIPPDREHEEVSILQRLRRGERIEHYETVRRTKDGRLIDVSLTVSPMRDQRGNVIGASKIARDVTSQRNADAALLELNDQLAIQLADITRLHEMSLRLATSLELQTILEESLRTAAAISDADIGLLSLCDRHGQLEAKASMGFDKETLEAVRHVPLGAGACGACFAEGRRVVIDDIQKDPRFAPYRSIARKMGIRAVHSTPLVSRNGGVLGVLTVHYRKLHTPSDREMRMIDLCARQTVDFIENARLYDQLQDSHKRKDEFLATLAHELRNPLAPISNSLQILRMSDEIGPSLQRVREIMEQQVTYMVRLVDDLLEVSRITRGKIELRKELVDVATLVANAVEMIRNQIDDNRLNLAITLPPESIMLEGDPVRLTQVIANLLGNAVKYTDPGGQIWLTAIKDDEQLVLTIRDTGVGIPAEMIERIFEMFSQVDRTFNRARGGLGIGLTLAKSLVELHGGTISARSQGPGMGSEFTVRLPVVETAPLKRLSLTHYHDNQALPVSRKILVVDDTRAAAYVLSKLLESLGQEVAYVNDGASAMQIVSDMRPDVIFSDIAMPHMDGYELATRIRELGMHDVTLVAVTGFGQREDRERAKAAGFDFHLVKPASVQAIRDLLSSVPVSQA